MVLKEEEEEKMIEEQTSEPEEIDGHESDSDLDEDVLSVENGMDNDFQSADESNKNDAGESEEDSDEGEQNEEDELHKPTELSKAELKKVKKVAPQRQKKLIHTLFKRAKIYEIRKLSRRISTLKSAKGTDEQLAKNQRKVERLSKEIECMREFMIEKLVERSIAVFKGTAESKDADLWKSCQIPAQTNDMIQMLSEKEGDHLQDIAYLRMLSSKDIVGKFQRISQGENLSRKRNKKNKRSKGKSSKDDKESIQNNDDGQEIKEIKQSNKSENTKEEKTTNKEAAKTTNKESAKTTNNGSVKTTHKDSAKITSTETVKTTSKETASKPKPKKMKKDSFFVDHEVEETDSSGNESVMSEDDEFTAPVKFDAANPNILNPKKNRMGQRERRKLQDKKYGRDSSDMRGPSDKRGFSDRRGSVRGRGGHSRGSGRFDKGPSRDNFRGSRGRGRGGFTGNTRGGGRQTSFAPKPPTALKKIDENLHPSWQAKQKQKAQQTITGFSGTKITFDD